MPRATAQELVARLKGINRYGNKTRIERCLEKIMPVTESGCWLWTHGLDVGGYAKFFDGKRSVSGHRYLYEHLVGKIPDGFELDHLCRVRCCVNPRHLEPVTRSENLLRSPLVGRHNRKK